MENEVSYLCDSCGEEIVIPVDLSAGSRQECVEDCPVCCNPMVIRIEVDSQGHVEAACAPEQDRF